MTFDRERHHRRSIRLPGYDYTQKGAYFVTICTYERACVLGQVEDGVAVLSESGRAVERCWRHLPRHFPGIELDAYVVMPNHIHGIVIIADRRVWDSADPPDSRLPRGTCSGSLGAIIQNFKSVSARRVNRTNGALDARLWQRNYYEHIIRSERALDRVREYIEANPLLWASDEENPDNWRGDKRSRRRT